MAMRLTSSCFSTSTGSATKPFGKIFPPRTRNEKVDHLKVLGLVPMEIVPAMDERKSINSGLLNKRTDPIGSIVMRYSTSLESELIDAMMKACATRNFSPHLWKVFEERSSEISNLLTPVDCGILIKGWMVHNRASGELASHSVCMDLLEKICVSVEKESWTLGNYTVLYGIQCLNMYARSFDHKRAQRCFNVLFKNLRVTDVPFPALIGITQAVSVRSPLPSGEILKPLFHELNSRFSSFPDCDPDMMFGLLSALGRFHISPEIRSILLTAQTRLISDDSLILSGYSIGQVSGVSHAYSRLGPALANNTTGLFSVIGTELTKCDNAEWDPRITAVAVNAFATASVLHMDLMDRLVEVFPMVVSKMDARQLAMSTHALSRLNQLGRFPIVKSRCAELTSEFDLHSLSKVSVALLSSSNMGKGISGSDESALIKLLERITMTVKETSLSMSDLDSVLLMLHALKGQKGVHADRAMEALISDGVTAHIDKVSYTKLATLLYAFANLSQAGSSMSGECIRTLNRSSLDKLLARQASAINNGVVREEISISDLARMVHAFSLNLASSMSSGDRACIQSLTTERISAISSLSYRPLSRLISGLIRCGVSDPDLLEALQERLETFHRPPSDTH